MPLPLQVACGVQTQLNSYHQCVGGPATTVVPLCSTALSRVYEAARSRLLKGFEDRGDERCEGGSKARLEALPVAKPPDMQSLGAAWEGVAYCSEAVVWALQIQLEACAAAGALRSADVREKVWMTGM
jgi:hypothetical protein